MDFYKTYLMPFFIGLLPVLMNCLYLLLKEHRAKGSRLRFLVAHVATCLESYSLDSLHTYHEWHNYICTHGLKGIASDNVPCVLQNFPKDVDWTVLQSGLLSKIVAFPNRIKISERSVQMALEYHDENEQYQMHIAILTQLYHTGDEAWSLAQELRQVVSTTSPHQEYLTKSWGYIRDTHDEKVEEMRQRGQKFSFRPDKVIGA